MTAVIRDASIVSARPVVPPPIAEYGPPDALVAGSQINKAAIGGPYQATELDSGSSLNKAQEGSWWVPILNGAIKFFNSYRPNALRDVSTHNVGANYGGRTSVANFGFRGYEFGTESFAGMPLSNASRGGGHRPEWNNLVPIIWNLRVQNPATAGVTNGAASPQTIASQFTRPTDFTPSGTASLSMKGEVLT